MMRANRTVLIADFGVDKDILWTMDLYLAAGECGSLS